MQKLATALPEVFVLAPDIHGDARGYFIETYRKDTLRALGIEAEFVQDNLSYTQKKGTLRGLHFQNDPAAQGKLVRAGRGAVLDVAVDLRRGSPRYLQWTSTVLTAENRRMLYVPRGFGHGFVTLTDDVEFVYKVDNFYSAACDRSIRFDDPAIGIDWQIVSPILSKKDTDAPPLAESDCNFVYNG